MTVSAEPPTQPLPSAGAAMSPAHVHLKIWATAESCFRQAQRQLKQSPEAAGPLGWRSSIVAGLSYLYSVLRLCGSPKEQVRYFGRTLVLGADTEAKTRLRIAQILVDWGEDIADDQEESEAERQLKRALLAVPGASNYVATKYAIIAVHCRVFVRRGERKWAEQRLKAAFYDAQQRQQYRWMQYFLLELSNLCFGNGDARSSVNALQLAIKQAQQAGDRRGGTLMAIQQLGRLVQVRDWVNVQTLADSLAPMIADPAIVGAPHLRVRFWTLRAVAAATQGAVGPAQEMCAAAREALKDWQRYFAQQLAEGRGADGGAMDGGHQGCNLPVSGWTYYEGHAWVMLVSAHVTRGDNCYERASGFLRLALEGVARGEADGMARQLLPVKILVLLNIVDTNLAALYIAEARQALDRVMSVLAASSSQVLWRSSRDAVALRWAMVKHRIGDFDQAAEAYSCVSTKASGDLRYAALVSLSVLYLSKPTPTDQELTYVHQALQQLNESVSTMPNGDRETVRRAWLEFLRGMESKEPVKSKTHLLACLRLCNDAAATALQGWTLCLLGTMVLSTGQYDQAMKMCAAGQAIAQRANDPLQNAAAVGILAQIEKAIGDPDRCAQLIQVDEQLLQQFNAQIQDAN